MKNENVQTDKKVVKKHNTNRIGSTLTDFGLTSIISAIV